MRLTSAESTLLRQLHRAIRAGGDLPSGPIEAAIALKARGLVHGPPPVYGRDGMIVRAPITGITTAGRRLVDQEAVWAAAS